MILKLKIKPGTRVLDLGGSPSIRENVLVPLDITILNLPGGIPSRRFPRRRTLRWNSHTTSW